LILSIEGECIMKARSLIAILAALSVTGGVSSEALAGHCSMPASGYFSDVIPIGAFHGGYLDCLSRDANDVVKYARASANASSTSDYVTVDLDEGTYAYAGGYNSSRQGIFDCWVTDVTAGNTGETWSCNGQVVYYDMYVENY
jgi:hypothetical protein